MTALQVCADDVCGRIVAFVILEVRRKTLPTEKIFGSSESLHGSIGVYPYETMQSWFKNYGLTIQNELIKGNHSKRT
jgi:hypothetical protein